MPEESSCGQQNQMTERYPTMMYENYEGRDLQGMVLRLEKSSVYDGEGFRTVVFLKGCPLRCQWCSTPESQNFEVESTLDGSITYGKKMTVEEVLVEVRKDSLFYFHSDGGMTLSGGEIMAQPAFVLALLRRARFEAIDTCIETSLYAGWDVVQPVLDAVDNAFIDLKMVTEEKHRIYTGISNRQILDNLKKAGNSHLGEKIMIRTPLIPGVNDSEEELVKIGRFVGSLSRVHYIQLLPYHRLGTDTYRKLGRPYQLADVKVPSRDHMEWCREVVGRASGVHVILT